MLLGKQRLSHSVEIKLLAMSSLCKPKWREPLRMFDISNRTSVTYRIMPVHVWGMQKRTSTDSFDKGVRCT